LYDITSHRNIDVRRSNQGMKPRRRADRVVIDFASEISAGRFPTGSVLPTEQVLGERFDASLTVMREALARLAVLG
jgi:DNA-binding FadR family transcriptional regulator